MSICYCCLKAYDIGCISSCELIRFPLFAAEAGLYTFVTKWLESEVRIEALFAQGEQLRIQHWMRNVNFSYSMNIFDTSGNPITLIDEFDPEIPYDCFKFKTIISNTYIDDDNCPYPYA